MASTSSTAAAPGVPLASEAIDFSIAPIVINVGASPSQRFYADEAMIRKSSKFFDAALNKEWKEGQERIVNLPETQPAAFNVYLNWLTTGKLHVHDQPETAAGTRQINTKLVEAYVLGDKILDVDYKDHVCDTLARDSLMPRNAGIWVMGAGVRRRLYENTVAGAPARRFLVGMLLMCGDISSFVTEDEPPALLHDIMSALVAGQQAALEQPAALKQLEEEDVKACKFHDHEPGAENCYRNKRRGIV
ncbi:hypothetical protein CBER1_09935 [Cercospora berteroae]|uniref:BTB domain-containing protein n=1 Tax=Cercospora berteroae TaxID=357750 RepID=A0A2S6CCP5_9PEZI|nr:hypothetical protein CBER1_09935 [Cercospora berteroae]